VAELRNSQWRRLLAAYDYHRQLERGYSVTRDASGAIVRSVGELAIGEQLETQLADGSVGSSVVRVDRDRTRPRPETDAGGSQ
jgi:exonuclease VII large subunit